MAGIAGIAEAGRTGDVTKMLEKIEHRGRAGRLVVEIEQATLGVAFNDRNATALALEQNTVRDYAGKWHFAEAKVSDEKVLLSRDPVGVAPLYYGRTGSGAVCFASEVKAILTATDDVRILPPGCSYDGIQMKTDYFPDKQPLLREKPEVVAKELRRKLTASVERCIAGQEVGAWLSGGLDSSTMAALARPFVKKLHTFSAGLAGAPDLEYAREVADFLEANHHEARTSMNQMLQLLPEVIYHLESFDALLVRSSVANYLAGKAAAEYVTDVLSGEGGDEMFAGYEYLKTLQPDKLADELIDITARLHNTALQRVDRCASAHGVVAHVPFLDPDVVEYVLRIPVEFKIHGGVEKWILRRALDDALPQKILQRRKAKFWEGAGIGELLAQHADGKISDADFGQERILPNGWTINTKEELMYYRIFRERFGELGDLSWMGRTKGAPSAATE
ncbi:MAG: asparagine synthase-related protein [Candidatus Eisenbacteria bacterium]|nr:asparagine synthase-related protein [Candidatus Eisenbacteria bacterium]